VSPLADLTLRRDDRPRLGGRPGARAAAAIAATVSLAALAAGCGGSPGSRVAQVGSTTTKSSTVSSATRAEPNGALAFSACVRSHGVTKFPDPASGGDLPKVGLQQLGVSSSRFQSARAACQHLLPNGDSGFRASLTQCLMTGDCAHALVRRALTEGRRFAQCMRNHGVPHWPDPAIDSTGRPSFPVVKAGISIDATRSPQMLSKIGDCQSQPGSVLLRQE
jgi:hypothetical protein